MDFLKIAFACEVTEGYGMTETTATGLKTLPYDPTCSGFTGPPQPVNEIKLVDVPSMGYTSEDKPNPRGELCMRGPNCFSGYYKDEKNTKEAIDADGWLHSGDIAEMDSSGRVKIIDRIKNIMKLSQGEYVALEKIENTYSSASVISQIYVHGDSLQSYIVAVVVPDLVQLANIASSVLKRKIAADQLEELSKVTSDRRIQEAVLSIMSKEAERNGLKGFEKVKRVHLTLRPFTIEEGTLTPTLKIKRKDAYKLYKTAIDGLYKEGEP